MHLAVDRERDALTVRVARAPRGLWFLRTRTHARAVMVWLRWALRSRRTRRRERVWALVTMCGGEVALSTGDAIRSTATLGLIDSRQWRGLGSASAADHALADALIGVERERRRSQVQAMEEVLSWPPSTAALEPAVAFDRARVLIRAGVLARPQDDPTVDRPVA